MMWFWEFGRFLCFPSHPFWNYATARPDQTRDTKKLNYFDYHRCCGKTYQGKNTKIMSKMPYRIKKNIYISINTQRIQSQIKNSRNGPIPKMCFSSLGPTRMPCRSQALQMSYAWIRPSRYLLLWPRLTDPFGLGFLPRREAALVT